MKHNLVLLTALGAVLVLPFVPAFAAETPASASAIDKTFSAAIAFAAAAIAAGLAIGRAGAAGLAATSERPEIRTTAILITALGEAIGIYGIVIAILILGA